MAFDSLRRMLNNGTDVPLGSPACGNCKNVDCTSAPKCFDYKGYNFGNCTYKNDIPKACVQPCLLRCVSRARYVSMRGVSRRPKVTFVSPAGSRLV